jgi:hypothetical protein
MFCTDRFVRERKLASARVSEQPIDSSVRDEVRGKAVFPGDESPLLTLRADLLTEISKPAHSSRLLPSHKQ